jgi:hypothetical protein
VADPGNVCSSERTINKLQLGSICVLQMPPSRRRSSQLQEVRRARPELGPGLARSTTEKDVGDRAVVIHNPFRIAVMACEFVIGKESQSLIPAKSNHDQRRGRGGGVAAKPTGDIVLIGGGRWGRSNLESRLPSSP